MGKGQQVANDLGDAVSFGDDALKHLPFAFGARHAVVFQQLREIDHGIERVVDLVGDAVR